MIIKSLIIHNYRSFCESHEVKFNYKLNRPVTIFGPSGSGKSNFLKALLYGVGHKYAGDYSFKKEDYYFCDTSKNLGVSVYLGDLPENYQNYNYTSFSAEYLDGTPECKQKIIGSSGTKSLWKDWRRSIPLYVIDSENIREQFRLKTSYGTYTPFGRYINAIKEDFNSDFEYYPEEVNGKEIKRLEFLRNLLNVITQNVINTEKFESFLEEFNSRVKEAELSFTISEEDFFDKLDLKIKDNESKPDLPLSYVSESFLYELLNAFFDTVSSSEGSVFIFNTPEKLLDSKLQKELYKKCEALAVNNQVLIISSSTNFVSLDDARTLIKLENINNMGTEFKQTYHINKNSEDIKTLDLTFPDYKEALLYDRGVFVYDIENYIKLKKAFSGSPIFYVHKARLEDDLTAIFSDLGIQVLFIGKEYSVDDVKEFLN